VKPLRSTFADDPEMAALVREYILGLPAYVSQLNEALRHEDFDALQKLAHQFTGSGGGYGFPAITAQARIVVEGIRPGSAAQSTPADVNMLIELLRSVDGFKSD